MGSAVAAAFAPVLAEGRLVETNWMRYAASAGRALYAMRVWRGRSVAALALIVPTSAEFA